MRKMFVIITNLMASILTANGQNNPIFIGGIADGFAVNCYNQSNFTGFGDLFRGGPSDGFSVNCYNQSNFTGFGDLFRGGLADGFALNCFNQADITGTNEIFKGGIADGFALGSYGSFGNELPLPVELLSFSAMPAGQGNVISQWTTATEINNDYFTVEKSRDGNEFEETAKVKGAGNSSSLVHYSFTDEYPYQGISYYRLKQTDFDGQVTCSDKVAVNLNENVRAGFRIFPNPVSSEAYLLVSRSADPENLRFELTDVTGRIIMIVALKNIEAETRNLFKIPVQHIYSGVYFYRIFYQSECLSAEKLIVEH